MQVEKHWVSGGELFVQVSSDDREELVDNIRKFALQQVEGGKLKREDGSVDDLRSWASSGVEKVDSPLPYDPEDPEADVYELARTNPGKKFKWRYKQTVRMTRPI